VKRPTREPSPLGADAYSDGSVRPASKLLGKKAHEPDKPRQINMIVLEDVMKMELIRGTLQLVIFAIAVLLGIIALCAVAEGGIRRKRK
jgi:hypothetical protein